MSTEQQGRRILTPIVGIVFAAALLLLVGYSLFANRWGAISVSPVDVGPAPGLPSAVAETTDKVMQSIEAERQAVARARLLELKHAGDAARELIDELDEEEEHWEREIATLLESDAGRLLAADDQSAEAFRHVYFEEASLPSENTPDRLRELLDTHVEPLEAALNEADAAYTPGEDLAAQIEALAERARTATDAYRQPYRKIQALLDAARRAGATPAEQTLAATLNEIDARRAREDAARRLLEEGRAEEIARARSRLTAVLDRGNNIEHRIAALQDEVTRWQNEIIPLLTNDEGRLVAGEDISVEVFEHLYFDQTRPAPETPTYLQQRLEAQLAPVRTALKENAAYMPSEAVDRELDDIEDAALKALAKYQAPREQIQGMIAAARSERRTPASITIEQAIAALQEERATEQAKLIAEAIAAEREIADEKIAQLEALNERNAAARELERRRLEEEQRKQAHEHELAKARLEEEQRERERERELERMNVAERQRESEHQRDLVAEQEAEKRRAAEAALAELRKRAADPAVQAKYQPFLGKGRYMFRRSGHPGVDPVQYYDYPVPASLQRLKGTGVLLNASCFWQAGMGEEGYRPDNHGYKGQGHGNDRPLYTMVPQTEEDWKEVQTRFDEFQELAPIWVEMELLQP